MAIGGYWNGEIGERQRPLRFGPNLDLSPPDPVEGAKELARMIRETMERMRTPLWFWQDKGEGK